MIILTHNKGKPFYVTNSNVSFTGSLYFDRNNADSTCTFAAVDGSKVIFAEHTSFSNNYVWQSRGSLCIYSGSNVTFSTGGTEFIKNQGEGGSAIYAHSSYLNFHGNVIISENVAYRGGGLSLYGGAIMIINPNTYINFTGNTALHRGGAIYVHDKDYYFGRYGCTQCFFWWPEDESQSTMAEMYFQGNYADGKKAITGFST